MKSFSNQVLLLDFYKWSYHKIKTVFTILLFLYIYILNMKINLKNLSYLVFNNNIIYTEQSRFKLL